MCLAQTLTSGTQVNFTGPNEGPIEGTVFIEEFLPVQRDAEGTRIDCRSIQVFYGDGWTMQHEKLPSSAWRAASPDRFTCTDLHRWPFFSPFFLHSIRRLISHFFQNWIPFKNGSLHILARNGFFGGKNVALWARIWRAIMFWPTWHRRKGNRRFNDCSHFKRKMKELSSSLATRMSSNFRKITKLKKNSSNFLSPSPTIATKSHQVPSSSPSPIKSHLSHHILKISSKNELEQQKFKLKGKRFFN